MSSETRGKSYDCSKYHLLPCPRCGSENLYLCADARDGEDSYDCFEIWCHDCHIRSGTSEVPYNDDCGEYYEEGDGPYDDALAEFIESKWNSRKVLPVKSVSDKVKHLARHILSVFRPKMNYLDFDVDLDSMSDMEKLLDLIEKNDIEAEKAKASKRK